MAGVAATVVTDLAAPDGDKRTGVAVRASPGKDIPVCRLHDDENVTRALVGHFVAICSMLTSFQFARFQELEVLMRILHILSSASEMVDVDLCVSCARLQ